MKRTLIAIFALLFGLHTPAFAQVQTVERAVKGQVGSDIRIGIFASIRPDCTAGLLPVIRLKGPPAHGKVTVKQAKLRTTNFRQCLATEVPAFIVIYRSVPDFSGNDVVILEIIDSGGKTQIQKITVTIGATAKGLRI